MIAFIGRSVIQKIVTLFFVSVVSFAIIHLAPGEPSQVDPLNPKFTPEMVERFRQAFHLDQPLYVQYASFYRDLLSGRTISWKDNQPVLPKIRERFLNSLPLFIVGTLITWTISFPVGIRSAIFRGGAYDRSATFISYVMISIPGFFFAYMLIIFVVSQFHVPVIGMQTFGMTDTAWLFRVNDRLWHMLLPSVLGATGGIAVLSRYVRSQMLEVESQDYVRTARAKGMTEPVVLFKHVLRNAMIPILTNIGLQLPGIFVGSFLIEVFFSIPGLGREVLLAVNRSDFPVIQAVTIYLAVLTMVINLLTDVAFKLADPRVVLK